MFASLQNKRKIEDATSPKDEVAPVYLLEEIWQIVSSAPSDSVVGIVEFVNRRLTHKSPVVKQKTLRLIKFICGKGASDFKRQISKHAGAVRELTHYKGDPDAFKGDVPNQKVRDLAKEALDAMFAPTEMTSYAPAASSLQSRIRGFGSSGGPDGAAPPTGLGSSSSIGMTGFGNPRFENASSSGGGGFSGSSSSFGLLGGGRSGRGQYEAPSNNPASIRSDNSFGGMMQRVGSGALSPKAIMNSIANKSNEMFQGKRGPGILNNDDSTGYSSDEADRGYTRPSGQGLSIGPSSLAPKSRPENGGGGSDEARLVDQICTPGGLRAQPSRDDLRVFVESAGSLSGTRIAECLEDKLGELSWQAVLRALCALEAVTQQGSTAACGEIAVYFQTNPGALEGAMDSPQASVRQRASRVLQLLGISHSATVTRSTTPAPHAPAASASAPDLLGGLDEPQVSATPAPHSSGGGGDLLGDLMAPPAPSQQPDLDLGSSTSPAPAAISASQGDLFGGLEMPAAHPAPAANGGGDLFGGLDVGGPASPAKLSNPAQDLMGLSQPAPTAAPAGRQPLTMDLFGEPAAPGTSMPPGPSAASSGLADMFSGLSTNGPTQPLRQPTPPQPSKPLDPLSGFGLPTQHQQLPMGSGLTQRQGSGGTPGLANGSFQSMPGVGMQPAGSLGMQGQLPGMQQITPQQMQYIQQMQYMQYMQQVQAMQARGMQGGFMPQMGAGPPQQQQQQPFMNTQQPQPSRGMAGAPISLDVFQSQGSGGTAASSAGLGISQQSDFDFVGDHITTLRGKR